MHSLRVNRARIDFTSDAIAMTIARTHQKMDSACSRSRSHATWCASSIDARSTNSFNSDNHLRAIASLRPCVWHGRCLLLHARPRTHSGASDCAARGACAPKRNLSRRDASQPSPLDEPDKEVIRTWRRRRLPRRRAPRRRPRRRRSNESLDLARPRGIGRHIGRPPTAFSASHRRWPNDPGPGVAGQAGDFVPRSRDGPRKDARAARLFRRASLGR